MIDSSEAGSPASDEKRIRKKGLEIEVRKEKSKKGLEIKRIRKKGLEIKRIKNRKRIRIVKKLARRCVLMLMSFCHIMIIFCLH